MNPKLDPKFVRQTSEEREFSHLLYRDVGAGLFDEGKNPHEYMPGLKGLDFKITISEKGVNIWVRPEDYKRFKEEKKKALDRKSMKDFLSVLPHLTIIGVIVSILNGLLGLFNAYRIGSIFSFQTNGWIAFLWNAIPVAVIWSLCLIYFALRKGRTD